MKAREFAYFFPLHLASRTFAGYTFPNSYWLIRFLSRHHKPHWLECPWCPWPPNFKLGHQSLVLEAQRSLPPILCEAHITAGLPNPPLPHTRHDGPTPVTPTPVTLRLGRVQPSRPHGQAHSTGHREPRSPAAARGPRAPIAPSP